MIAAVALAPEEGTRIDDGGPPEDDDRRKVARRQARARRSAMQAEGVLRQVLHGPKGEARGVLFEDGRAGRFPPHAGAQLTPLLVTGGRLLLRGDGLSTRFGTVVAVREIGTSPADMRRIDFKPDKHVGDRHAGGKRHKHAGYEADPDMHHAT